MSGANRLHTAIDERPAVAGLLCGAGSVGRPEVPVLRRRQAADLVSRTAAQPLVSVVIPCFNYGRFLASSVGSALSQHDVVVDVIVVDDASTDDSAAVADALASADSRVTVVHNDSNSGHVVTFNNGAARARGEFLVRLDADDLLTPGSLARAVALFRAEPSVGLVYGHPRHFVGDAADAYQSSVRGATVWRGADWLAERCRTGVNCITTPEAIVRRSVLQDIGLLNTTLKYAQDMEMWLRVAAVSDVARVDGADQAWHRDHEASMSVTIGAGVLVDLQERRTVFDVLFKAVGDRIVRAEELHDQARRTLAAEALDRVCRAYDRGKVDQTPVEELLDFARETDPGCTESRGWQKLRRRQQHPKGPRHPQSLAAAARRRLNDEFAYAYWVRTGL